MSLSKPGMIWSAMSMTVTARPFCIRFSATSRPMKPPPATTARLAPVCSRYSRSSMASCGVRMVKTPGNETPGNSGTMEEAPQAMMHSS